MNYIIPFSLVSQHPPDDHDDNLYRSNGNGDGSKHGRYQFRHHVLPLGFASGTSSAGGLFHAVRQRPASFLGVHSGWRR